MKNINDKIKLYEKGLSFFYKKDYLNSKNCFEKILSLDPSNKESLNSLGVIYRILNNHNLSIQYFKMALVQDRNYSDALKNLTDIYDDNGEKIKALRTHLRLLEIDPENENNLIRLTTLLKNTQLTRFNAYLDKYLTILFEKKIKVDVANITSLLISLIKLNPKFIQYFQLLSRKDSNLDLSDLNQYFEKLKLLIEVIPFIEIRDFDLEFCLYTSRKIILLNLKKIKISKFLENFLCSLSLTCFKNEYIYKVTKEEEDELLKIEKKIEKSLFKKEKLFDLEILILSTYKGLVEYSCYNQLDKFKYQTIYKVQVSNYIEEEKIKLTIKEQGPIEDKTSLEMKNQYELYPYPRWTEKNFEKLDVTLSDYCNNLNLSIQQNKSIQRKDLKILVAGCGTGLQSIDVSLRFPKSEILAIDLSKSSLAYAIRKTKELNINNINYLCMDILNINSLNESFDYISCGGVLHHMKNPILGWKSLLECLNKNGLLEVALYSKLARRDIISAKRNYNIKKDTISLTDLRNIRYKIINENISLTNTLHSEDFFSLSGFKDLFANENEVQYEIEDIKKILNNLKLSFCGFQLTDYQIQILKNEKAKYLSFNEWKLIEKKHPHFFSTMYHFWCQKVS